MSIAGLFTDGTQIIAQRFLPSETTGIGSIVVNAASADTFVATTASAVSTIGFDVSGATDNQVLTYDSGSNTVIWADGGGGGSGITALAVGTHATTTLAASVASNTGTIDFNISGASSGQVPQYNGTNVVWASISGGSGITALSIDANAATTLAASVASTTGTIGFDVADATNGQVLTFDGTSVVWADGGSGGGIDSVLIGANASNILRQGTVSNVCTIDYNTASIPNNSVPTCDGTNGMAWRVPNVNAIAIEAHSAAVLAATTASNTATIGFNISAPPPTNAVPTFNGTDVNWVVPTDTGLTSVGIEIGVPSSAVLVAGPPITANGDISLDFNLTGVTDQQVPMYKTGSSAVEWTTIGTGGITTIDFAAVANSGTGIVPMTGADNCYAMDPPTLIANGNVQWQTTASTTQAITGVYGGLTSTFSTAFTSPQSARSAFSTAQIPMAMCGTTSGIGAPLISWVGVDSVLIESGMGQIGLFSGVAEYGLLVKSDPASTWTNTTNVRYYAIGFSSNMSDQQINGGAPFTLPSAIANFSGASAVSAFYINSTQMAGFDGSTVPGFVFATDGTVASNGLFISYQIYAQFINSGF